jgi:hypothetical protein
MTEVKVSSGLEDRLLEYAAAAEAVAEHRASDAIVPGLLPALPLLNSPEAFVTDMKEAAVLVAAIRDIIEGRVSGGSLSGFRRKAVRRRARGKRKRKGGDL